MRRRFKATIAAAVLVAGGTTYYVVHEQQVAACRPTVNQVNALWTQSAALLGADMSPSPGFMSDPAFEARMLQIQYDGSQASDIDKRAAAIVVAHTSCFDSIDVTNAKQWLKH